MSKHIKLNASETAYLLDGKPLFCKTFTKAMSFHWPEGLAAVHDKSAAYHINSKGQPAYAAKFVDACGFYEGLASVQDDDGWFHIRPDASHLHKRRFRWSGNYQESRCVVLDHDGFFHIDAQGRDAYSHRFRYVGDYRHGVAVAYGPEGAFHIDLDGNRINTSTFRYAEPFHKAVALVADERGFFHVDRDGRPLHDQRFMRAEPFYNGVAFCQTTDGQLIRLRESGFWTRIADATEPISFTEIKEIANNGTKVGLFVRHSERFPITPETPNWGQDVLLTKNGIEIAKAFGRQLATDLNLGLWSSPVERCRQTCSAFAEGAGAHSSQIEDHTHLGDPGIYLDGSGEHEEAMRTNFHVYALKYLDTGTAAGTRPLHAASEELISFLLDKMQPHDMTLFVTHAFFAAILMSYLGLKAPDWDDWCDYLEGVCILAKGSEVQFRRILGVRGQQAC